MRLKKFINEAKEPKVSFYTTVYKRSHGKEPKGRGGWAFELEEPELVKLLKDHKNISGGMANAIFVKGSMNLAQAKKVLKDAILSVWPEDAKVSSVDVEVAP